VTLAPYLEDVHAMRICPDDPKQEELIESLETHPGSTSYLINEFVANPAIDGSVANVEGTATSKLIVMFEGSDERAVTADHVHCSKFYDPIRVQLNIVWDLINKEIGTERHLESANYLYADGHVVSVTANDVHEWVDADISRGTHFAKPGN